MKNILLKATAILIAVFILFPCAPAEARPGHINHLFNALKALPQDAEQTTIATLVLKLVRLEPSRADQFFSLGISKQRYIFEGLEYGPYGRAVALRDKVLQIVKRSKLPPAEKQRIRDAIGSSLPSFGYRA